MFELNGKYANRIGKYTVIALNPPKMSVRYADGTEATLNMEIQARIWGNIRAEEESKVLSRAARLERRRSSVKDAQFFIKSISLIVEEDLSVPGWRERVAVVDATGPDIRPGDRFIYYAIEKQCFFAVATVTGPASDAIPKGFFYPNKDVENLRFFPIDLDAYVRNLDIAITLDSVELESQPNFRALLQKPDVYIKISEDDFELMAELLTEATEEEEDEEIEEEEEEEIEE